MKPKIILASASPRRRKILEEMGLTFTIVAADVDEIHLDHNPEETVTENAELKCDWAGERYPHAVVIAADTVVSFEGVNLGKPHTLDAAKAMLRKFSGKLQEVYSGVAIAAPGRKADVFLVKSEVHFKKLTNDIIDEYLNLVNPLDKAGGYDIDQHSGLIISNFTGSWTNIMGLPKDIVENWMMENRCK
jgi:septum formation protein